MLFFLFSFLCFQLLFIGLSSTLFVYMPHPNLSLMQPNIGRSVGIYLYFMKEKKNKEELQSRREFFKKAAKGALPILGAIVLAGTPAIVKAASHESKIETGCDWGCSHSCFGGCDSSCTGSCSISCTSCYGRCTGTCSQMCANDCSYGCKETCRGGCQYSCRSSCANSNMY